MEATNPIRAYRQENGLTQKQFADLCDVARTTVARWETDARKIDTEKVPKVSEVTGIPRSVLRPDLAELLQPEAG